ncbi:MAG: sigma-54 dependent transcriptional regulator [Steroidobacteraceae bacterium]
MSRTTVLVVDDEPDLVELVALTLTRMGLDSVGAGDIANAQRLLKSQHFDLCLTDMRLPDGDGLDLVAWIAEHRASVPCAVITAHGNVGAAVRALKAGAFDFVSKPLDLGVLRKLVASAVKLADRSGSEATRHGARLIGESPAIRALRDTIARVARSQAPVHICGESGTGKELAARLIHELGSRADGPFVAVNCGAIPTELLESELFGHKRGSFTGAVSDKQGLIPSAEGGTLFLDEVADLPLHMQVKLLRVIQEKTLRPVGESREQPIDVRILSATHRNLAKLVKEGRFREDLYYRINVIELRVPSLREHPEDIPDLAAAIIARLAQRQHGTPPEISAAAMQALREYAFPGNVRELENILERATTLCRNQLIDVADLQLRAAVPEAAAPQVVPAAPAAATPAGAPPPGDEALEEQLEGVERNAIVKALEQARYNKTAAAKALGITFRALRYRIKKLGIE